MAKGCSSREDFSPKRRQGYPVDGLRKKQKQKVNKGNTSWTRKKRSDKSGTKSKNTKFSSPPIVWESPRGIWPFHVPSKRPPLEFGDNIIKKKGIKVSKAKDDTRIKVNFIIAGKTFEEYIETFWTFATLKRSVEEALLLEDNIVYFTSVGSIIYKEDKTFDDYDLQEGSDIYVQFRLKAGVNDMLQLKDEDKKNVFVNKSSGGQYKNFNLKQNNSSNAFCESSKNVSSENRKVLNYASTKLLDFANNNYSKTQKQSHSWNKATKNLSPTFGFIAASTKALDLFVDNQDKTASSNWKKSSWGGSKVSEGLNFNDSTENVKDLKINNSLSLHIIAYEKSVEDGQNLFKLDNENLKQNKLGQALKTSTSKDLFEIPRQQTDGAATEPEVNEFKSKQKLLNTNDFYQIHQPTQYEKLKENANALFQAGRFLEAEKAYSDILKFVKLTSKEAATIYSNRAATYLKLLSLKPSLRKSKKDAEKAIKCNREWWKGYYRLACYFIEIENYEEARHYLLKALKLYPESEIIMETLNKVNVQIYVYKFNYQQRRLYYQMQNNNGKNGFELIQMFDALSITDEVERKRSRESDDLFVDPHDGFFNSSNISLISNENISSNDQVADADYSSNNNIVTLESSTDSIQIDESEAFTFSIDKSLTSKDLLLISLGIDNSFITHEVDLPPLNIPHLKGNYLYIVKAQNVKNLGDVVSVDKLSPWNNQKKGVRSKQYYVDFEVQENNIKKYTRSDSKNRDAFKNYTFEWQTNHHELPVNKKIIAVCQPNDKKPIENTKVCFYYEVKQDTPAIEKLSEKIHNPRLAPSDSAKIKQFLLNKHTPTAALHKHQQTSSLMDAVSTVTQSQVNNLARDLKDRSPPTNKGRKKEIDFDQILKLADDKRFVMEFSKSGGDIKIFCGVKAAFSMMESSLITVSAANELTKHVEEALKQPPNLRYSKLKEIVESEKYKNLTSCCYLDTTFNVSDLYLTILLFSSPFLTRKDGTPVCIISGIMLSTNKDAQSYEWMGLQLNKYITSNGRIMRSLATDADLALDGILKAIIFAPPCIRLHCGEHLSKNAESYIDIPSTKTNILNDLFGYVHDGIKLKGLFDELTFVDFERKLNYLISLDYWKQNPRIIEWLQQPARRQRLFKRVGLVSRIFGGWGFQRTTTNIIENQNMNLKTDIHDKTPVQILIPKLEKIINGQLISAGMSFIQMEPVQLRDLTKFVGTEGWRRLSVEKRKQLLLSIGLNYTESITGFQIVPITFPAVLAPNLSEEQRTSMVQKSKILEVFASSTKGSFVVNDSKPAKVIITDNTVACNCKYEQMRANICVHLLAVHFQHPHLKLIEKLLSKRDEQTMSQRHTASVTTTSGTKPGTSRRRAPPATRNLKRKPIIDILDLDDAPTPSATVNAVGTLLLPSVAPLSNYNQQRQLESRPIAVPQRQNTFHHPTSEALRNYQIAYNITAAELWFNNNAFFLKSGTNVRDVYKRRCAHCNIPFSKKDHPFVFTHLEKYQFTMKNTNEVKIGYGERIICARFACFGVRYPYATPTCIISEVDELTRDGVMQQLFPS